MADCKSNAETVAIVIASNAAPRVEFGAEKLVEAFKAVNSEAAIVRTERVPDRKIHLESPHNSSVGREGYRFDLMGNNDLVVTAGDDSGTLYGCLELAGRIRTEGKFPEINNYSDKPAMTLRGTCVGMQKTYILPGRKVYEYPYTPELFPWFYDRNLWREYLDFLVANRMNTLYLWNGHPFASLVRLKEYPEAVEVSDDVFAKNVEMFRWLATECDKRGIWLVQMFYNILLSKPFAEQHGLSTQLAAPTPLAADYTRKSIAEFVRQYPNVGLMVCLGEALRDTPNQLNWCTNVILPGVLDGLKGRTGFQPAPGRAGSLPHLELPPVIIRTHAMDASAIMPAAFQVYSNLFTESKYNGESLTTWQPRGSEQAKHLAMAKLGPHLVNVHILANLEPFRYGATGFIRKSVLASRDRLGASGIHLYPLSYWNWPDSPDIAEPPLKQWERDWIWFEAWARYAWNPDLPEKEDRAWWVSRLTERYGSTNAAEKILDAYNDAGEVAPRLIRRFGITEGNRQTLSLGMTLDQLVNPNRYGPFSGLWESQSPPGERLADYARKEWNHEPHQGETPPSILRETLAFAQRAVDATEAAAPLVTTNRAEFARLSNDVRCIQAMAEVYAAKGAAAMQVLRFNYSKDPADMRAAATELGQSFQAYERLVSLTEKTYRFANSMQTSQRKIPFVGGAGGAGTNYHWTQLVPLYEKELKDFEARVASLPRSQTSSTPAPAPGPARPYAAASFRLISTNAETYEVKIGARPFLDRQYTIREIAPELIGLTGIRFSHEAAKSGRYDPIEFEVSEPVCVFVGYFNDPRDIWLQVPNLDTAAHADERGGVETLIENAAVIEQSPSVNVHAFRYEAGRHKLELIGKGSFVVLGVVPQSVELKKRDAGFGK